MGFFHDFIKKLAVVGRSKGELDARLDCRWTKPEHFELRRDWSWKTTAPDIGLWRVFGTATHLLRVTLYLGLA